MGRGPGNKKNKIDRIALHEYLWKYRGRGDIVPITQTKLASNLDIRIETINGIFREFLAAGRMKRVGTKYQVVDPKLVAFGDDVLF